MNPLLLAIPVILFLALAATFLFVLNRAAALVARGREVDAFRREIIDLVGRIDASLSGVAGRIDGVRRHQLGPDAIDDNLAAALDAMSRYAAEAEALRAPAGLEPLRAALREDLGRAERALDMVRHGCVALAPGLRGPRQTEGQTSVKRGYLNILHARDALRRLASDAERVRPVHRNGRLMPRI